MKNLQYKIDRLLMTNDSFGWNDINCFHKPLAMSMEYLKQSGFNYYLSNMYLSEFMSQDDFPKNHIGNRFTIFDTIFHNTISSKVDVSFHLLSEKSEESLIQSIIELVGRNIPIIVPVDLKELYYFENYKKQSKEHYILIKGYSEEQRLFYILDTVHHDGGTKARYEDFVILYDTLAAMAKSYSKNFMENSEEIYFFHLNSISASGISNSHFNDLLKQILESDFFSLEDFRLKLDFSFSNQQNPHTFKDLESLRISHNRRKLGLSMVLNKKEMNDFDSQLALKSYNEFFELENKLINELIYAYLKKEDFNNSSLIEKLRRSRKDMYGALKNLLEVPNVETQALFKEFAVENEEYAEIFRHGDDFIISHFEEKVSNSWTIIDNSPRIFLSTVSANQDLNITCRIVVEELNGATFHCGMFLRFTDSNIIYFGLYTGSSIALTNPHQGRNYEFISDIRSNDIMIKIIALKGDLTFYYKYSSDSEWIKARSYSNVESLQGVGIFSKTWDNIKLKTRFTPHLVF